MENICEICGGDSVGYDHLLLTCSICNASRTHVYCLSVFTLEIPEVWNCESCLSGNDRISTEFAGKEDSLSSSTDMGHSRKLSGPRKVSISGWKLHSKRQRPVGTGKAKFLSQEEVVKLSSGASTKQGSPRKTASAFMSRKTTPTKPKSVNPKFFPERVEKATPPTPLRLMKLKFICYCLSVFTLEIPEVWNCESCLPGNDRISTEFAGKEDSLSSSTDMGHSRKLSGPRKVSISGWKLHSKRQRPVGTGKVKFLSQEEVVKLSSGASTKTESPRKTASAFMSRKTTPTKPKSVNPKFFPERVEKATPPTPSRLMKPGGFNRISMSNQQASRTSKEPKERTPLTSEKRRDPKKRLLEDLVSAEISLNKMDTKVFSCAPSSSRPIDPEKKTPTLPRKEHFAGKQPLVNEKQPVDSLIISREVETSNKTTDKEPAETRCTLLPSRHSPLDIRAEEELPNIPSNLDMYLTYLPALQTTWKGGFSIIDSAVSEVLEGFQAQPPCKVHKKAYEISTKMPPILQLKMLPRLHHWADLFEDGSPDLQDIALYFFRADDNMERYTEKYGQLFERMEIQSSIMIGHVNDVELLIFTSKQLNIHSQNILLSKAEKFFCGVFRKPPREECPELLSPLSRPNPNEASTDDSMNDDMQIDMVGGQSVGILDVVRPKDSSTCGSNEPKTNQASCALLKPKARPESVAREIDLSPQRPLVKFKLEPRKSHDKSPGCLKKVKPENAFENPSLIGPLKHSQEHIVGFPLKKRASFLAIKEERNENENPIGIVEKKRVKTEPY